MFNPEQVGVYFVNPETIEECFGTINTYAFNLDDLSKNELLESYTTKEDMEALASGYIEYIIWRPHFE